MNEKVIFDLSTLDSNIKSVSKIFGLHEADISNFFLTYLDDSNLQMFANHFNLKHDQLMNADLWISSLHVTTNDDECQSIQKFGMLNLQQATQFDTPLFRHLNHFDIKVNIDQKEVIHNGTVHKIGDYVGFPEGGTPRERITYKLFRDYQINGFFCTDNALDYGGYVNLRPEFLMDLSNLLKLKKVEEDWIKNTNKKCYVIKFMAPLSDYHHHSFSLDDDVVMEKTAEELDQITREWLLNTSLSNIYHGFFGSIRERISFIKPDKSIPPENIIRIYKENEYMDEYV